MVTVGYHLLKSRDNRTLVQIYIDLQTGSILHAEVRTRSKKWGRWEPATEVQKVD